MSQCTKVKQIYIHVCPCFWLFVFSDRKSSYYSQLFHACTGTCGWSLCPTPCCRNYLVPSFCVNTFMQGHVKLTRCPHSLLRISQQGWIVQCVSKSSWIVVNNRPWTAWADNHNQEKVLSDPVWSKCHMSCIQKILFLCCLSVDKIETLFFFLLNFSLFQLNFPDVSVNY